MTVPRFLAPDLVDAFAFAADVHAGQVRKDSGGEPYIGHLMAACAIAIEYGADLDQARAALLHDTIEDGDGKVTRELLEERFGARVARIVADCSDSDGTRPKPPWRERKQRYLEHLRAAPADSRLVSAADKLANARAIARDLATIGERVWDKFSRGRDDQLWYYGALVDALADGATGDLARLVDELRAVVARFG
ncbi:MAG: hypothetical protein Kow0062_12230 [Acidobacteriota bacterium]